MAMRNDNQQTKKKLRLPLFDIALLLLIAIAVAAGSYWVTQRDDRETVTVQYAIRFENVENTYSGAIAEAKELFSVSGTLMGEVASVRVTRSVEKTFDLHTPYEENGEYRYTETPSESHSDIYLIVTAEAELIGNGYFLHGNRIAAGMTVDAMVVGYTGQGEILSVVVAEVPAQQDGE